MKRNLNNTDIEEILNIYKSDSDGFYVSTETLNLISEKFSIPHKIIDRITKNHNISRSPTDSYPKIDKEETEYIINEYKKGISSEIIAADLFINGTTVCRILKKNNIEIREAVDNKRKRAIDDKWLDVIDTEEKAYFLGYMFSDGNVHKRNNDIKITLHKQDLHILETFATIFYGFPHIVKDREYFSLYLCSKRLKNRLIELGCHPNKTFTVKYPEWMPDHLHQHFIRGLMDGDGCIHIYKGSNRTIVDYTGTKELIDKMIEIMQKQSLIEMNVYSYKRMKDKKDNIYSFRLNRTDDIYVFLKWLYKGSTIHLERKFNSYNKFLDIYNNIYLKKYFGVENILKILNLHSEGNSLTNIAKVFNKNVGTISKVVNKHKKEPNDRQYKRND